MTGSVYIVYMFRGPECRVLDYQTQQLQLLPLLASAYVLNQLAYHILRQYNRIEAEFMAGNFDNIQEVCTVGIHCLLLKLKVI